MNSRRLTLQIVGLAAFLCLAACAPHYHPTDSYTNRDGSTTLIENNQEMCTHACNTDYERCNESDAAQRPVGDDVPKGLIGASADCRAALKNCLPRCKGQ